MCDRCINLINNERLVKTSSYSDLPGLTGTFYNLGVMQLTRSTTPLCYKCKYINLLLERLILEEVKVYYFVDQLLTSVGTTGFVDCIRNLTHQVLQGTTKSGRVFMLLSCVARAGRFWHQQNLDSETVTDLLRLTNRVLEEALKDFCLETFLTEVGLRKNKTFLEKVWSTLKAII